MPDEHEFGADHDTGHEADAPDDGRGSLAVAAGLVAALAGGFAWALLAILGNLEIGWAAWGIGALVGLAMARTTIRRDRSLQRTAAVLAGVGLIAGKVFVLAGGAGRLAEEIIGSPEYLQVAVARHLYESRDLPAPLLDSLDERMASDDTLTDALADRIMAEAADRMAQMSDEDRQDVARQVAEAAMSELGLVGGIAAQISLWDLLWFGLAIGTAYRMLAPQALPAEAEPDGETE